MGRRPLSHARALWADTADPALRARMTFLNRPDLPSVGAGETSIIGIAPAIANALFNAAQVRIRLLPIRNSDWQAAG